MELTTIAVTKKIKKELNDLKQHRKDSYLDVVQRLIDKEKQNMEEKIK